MLTPQTLTTLARTALAEDLGRGDLTSEALIPPQQEIQAVFVTRSPCVCAGLPLVAAVFHELDPKLHFSAITSEGQYCSADTELARISGNAQAILKGERTALNFLQRLCGIAHQTRLYVNAVRPYGTTILDTRKTTPGYRSIEKYAVRQGGGTNHRFGLYDAIMIKDNHRRIAALDSPEAISEAVSECRSAYSDVNIEVEADTTEQAEAGAEAGADWVLLDNMTPDELNYAVQKLSERVNLEASGNITLENVTDVAATGVPYLSIGALTHSVSSADIALDVGTSY